MIRALIARWGAAALGVALVLALALAGYQTHRADKAELALANKSTEFANYRAAAEEASRVATAERLVESQRRIKVQSEVVYAQVLKTNAIQAAADRAVARNRGLLDELAAASAAGRALGSDPAATAQCQAAGEASAVLADLLGQCSSRRRELALFADKAHLAAETCVGHYEGLTP